MILTRPPPTMSESLESSPKAQATPSFPGPVGVLVGGLDGELLAGEVVVVVVGYGVLYGIFVLLSGGGEVG